MISQISYFLKNQPEPDSPSFSSLRLQYLPITVNNINFKLHFSVNVFITVTSEHEEAIVTPSDDTHSSNQKRSKDLKQTQDKKGFPQAKILCSDFRENVPPPSQLTELKEKWLVGGEEQISAIFINILIPFSFLDIHTHFDTCH